MADVQWVVRRDGSAHEMLTSDRTWGQMADAARFASHDEANRAPRPAGTTGTAIQLHPDADV